MAFIAVYDANVLCPNTLRDLLIRIAQLPHLVQAKLDRGHPQRSDRRPAEEFPGHLVR